MQLLRNYKIQPLKYAELPIKEDLVTLYIEENKTTRELAKYFNKTKDTILKWLHKYNIKKSKEIIRQSIERVQLERYGGNYYRSKQYQAKKEQINQKRAITNLKKYGATTPAGNKEIMQKTKNTCLSNIDENGLNVYQRARKKGVKTCLKKYGVTTYSQTQECKNKTKDFFNKKYGIDAYTQAEEFKKKYREICLQKYGKSNYTQTKEFQIKTKQTKKEKYGDEYYNNRELAKQTCLKHFGKEYYTQTQAYIDKYCDKESIKLRQEKAYRTKKENGTFNVSKQEDKVSQLLLKKFPNVIRQYRNELYPYDCDFYIPEQDLYIETNFFWTHGIHNKKVLGAFNKENLEHIAVLEKWKQKNTFFYKQAIYTWTDLDVRKLECFKKNNLNYKIFYTMEEFNNWYSTI
jgi:hypothetical protein